MTPIANMVEQMLSAGLPAESIVLAVRTAELAANAASRNSTGIPVDEAAERRRAYDRDRKRAQTEFRRKSAENPRNSTPPLTLTSSPHKDSIKEGKKVRARKANSAPLSAEWEPNDKHFAAAEKLNIPRPAVLEKAEDMRIWAKGSGALKADWDATFHGFLRRDAQQLSRGYRSNGPSGKPTVHEAAATLTERIRQLNQGPPGIRSGEGTGPVRLISSGGRE